MAISDVSASLRETLTLPPQEVLTLREGANFLRISERKAWELVDQNLLPHFRIGNQIRFELESLRTFIRESQSKEEK